MQLQNPEYIKKQLIKYGLKDVTVTKTKIWNVELDVEEEVTYISILVGNHSAIREFIFDRDVEESSIDLFLAFAMSAKTLLEEREKNNVLY